MTNTHDDDQSFPELNQFAAEHDEMVEALLRNLCRGRRSPSEVLVSASAALVLVDFLQQIIVAHLPESLCEDVMNDFFLLYHLIFRACPALRSADDQARNAITERIAMALNEGTLRFHSADLRGSIEIIDGVPVVNVRPHGCCDPDHGHEPTELH